MTTTDDHDQSGTAVEQDGVFIEIDEDDPFVGLQLRVIDNGGDGFIAGGVEVEAGRYELKKVEDV